MWEARAEYADGTAIERLFESNPNKNENDEQYEIESWLISQRDGCTWYSVNLID
jgi:hypothetical protein